MNFYETGYKFEKTLETSEEEIIDCEDEIKICQNLTDKGNASDQETGKCVFLKKKSYALNFLHYHF